MKPRLYPLTAYLCTPVRRLADPWLCRLFSSRWISNQRRWLTPGGEAAHETRMRAYYSPGARSHMRHPCDEHRLRVQAARRKVRR